MLRSQLSHFQAVCFGKCHLCTINVPDSAPIEVNCIIPVDFSQGGRLRGVLL